MGKTVLTFGEIMMRLSPKDHLRIEQATEFDVRYGGAEANTALSLAYQGDKAAYVSVVPANRLGECALRSLKAYDVDTSRVVRQGDRLGSYVFEVNISCVERSIWMGMLFGAESGERWFSPAHDVHVLEGVAAGDAFNAGLVHALINGFDPQDAVNYAIAASILKLTIKGDSNLVTADEIAAVASAADGGTRVAR